MNASRREDQARRSNGYNVQQLINKLFYICESIYAPSTSRHSYTDSLLALRISSLHPFDILACVFYPKLLPHSYLRIYLYSRIPWRRIENRNSLRDALYSRRLLSPYIFSRANRVNKSARVFLKNLPLKRYLHRRYPATGYKFLIRFPKYYKNVRQDIFRFHSPACVPGKHTADRVDDHGCRPDGARFFDIT